VPGVLDILTFQNANVVRPLDIIFKGGQASSSIVPLSSPKIWHDGQIVAMVVADTFEAASEAAFEIGIEYDEQTPTATFGCPGTTVKAVADVEKSYKDPTLGDAEQAFSAAPVTVDAEYSTPPQHHNAMELFTTTCVWNDDKLTVLEPSRFVYGMKYGLAEQLGMNPEDVHVVSPLVGGAFGAKGFLTQQTALTAIAALRLGRPVKLAATRKQGFTIATYRAETRHHVRLGASRDGRIVAYLHEGWELTSRPDDFHISGTTSTAVLYDYGAVATKVNVVNADRNTPGIHALASRDALFVRARKRDGRAGARARHGPGRAAPAQRHDEGSCHGTPLLETVAGPMFRCRRQGFRLAQTIGRAGLDARPRLARRLGMRNRLLSDNDGAMRGERSPDVRRLRSRIGRRARDRQRRRHCYRPGRGRTSGHGPPTR